MLLSIFREGHLYVFRGTWLKSVSVVWQRICCRICLCCVKGNVCRISLCCVKGNVCRISLCCVKGNVCRVCTCL